MMTTQSSEMTLQPNPKCLKVLWVVAWWPNWDDPYLGIFNKRWAQLISDAVDLTIVAPEPNTGVAPTRYDDHVETYKLAYKLIRIQKSRSFYIREWIRVVHSLRGPKFDVCHIISPSYFTWLGAKLFGCSAGAVVVTDHSIGSLQFWHRKGAIYKYFYRRCYKMANLAHVVSLCQRDVLSDAGLTMGLPLVVAKNAPMNGIGKFAEQIAKRKAKLGSEGFTFIHVSGLAAREKNVEGILCAFALVRRVLNTRFTVQLRIVGSGSYENYLRGVSVGLKLQNSVTWCGACPETQVASEMASADCFLLFSRKEVDSVVVTEALHLQLPVITSDVCGLREKVSTDRGTVLAEYTELSLADAMLKHVRTNWRRTEPLLPNHPTQPQIIKKTFLDMYTVLSLT